MSRKQPANLAASVADRLLLHSKQTFDGELLKTAIHATFVRRKTPLPSDEPVGLTDRFGDDSQKQRQWTAFLKRAHARKPVDTDLKSVVNEISAFLVPPMLAAGKSESLPQKWPKGGPWQV